VRLEIVVQGDIIDACLNGRRCLVARRPAVHGDNLFLFCQNGAVRFDQLVVEALSFSQSG
jgi:hypothetical protein